MLNPDSQCKGAWQELKTTILFWICFRKTKIDTSFHQFTCLSKQCTGNYASRHISDWWNCKMNFTLRIFQLLPKIRKNNRGRGQPLLEECCDISGNKERFSALYFTNVLSTKWCSLLLYSLTSAVYAKLITGVYILALWVLQCEFSPHPQSLYSRTVSGSRAIATKSRISISHMGDMESPTCLFSFHMQKKNEVDKTVIN